MKQLSPFTIHRIQSQPLKRVVRMDMYWPSQPINSPEIDLLIVNDGQDLLKMDVLHWLNILQGSNKSLLIAAVHAGVERKQEYGVMGKPDFMNRGAKADLYTFFILEELLPFVKRELEKYNVQNTYVAGFSLGGLMAFDLALEFPSVFNAAGVFSGSFWWRSVDLNEGYIEERDRIMHAKIKSKQFNNHQRFFLQTGAKDETADRNNNGIIDSIDDTLDIIKALAQIGFNQERQIKYLELADGSHDIATWSRVMPDFLGWLYQK